ncbi:3'-5' exonuclease [Paenibacillus radicis (ex Xue et al. 2023)]|uniref:Exonuclease domain-containing protein n=1 Tax=Paenibacillus radicis (ex Xue et al. 2023) TaxID=2972489 RepID=A0ABT1YEV0_9BACL|nr:3'-5' exonuclease [Paenibacillus radicis (ex Xue et al. 2023)]MCR8631699.1 exonuclease domain-containing protein [Paenibacillus radicis (ex Xue et al. 2023)]
MSYIVIDLEFNGRKHYDIYPMEIIEIGAVKLDRHLNIVDTFQSYVNPNFELNRFALKFCGIEKETLHASPSYQEVISRFITFCGEDYKMFAWGGSDFFNLFVDCKVNKVNNEWLGQLIDLTQFFDGGLQQALEAHELIPIGQHHSALDDALNAAQLLKLKPEVVASEQYFAPNEFKICTGGIKKWIALSHDHAVKIGNKLTWEQFTNNEKTKAYFRVMNLTVSEIAMVETLFHKYGSQKFGRKYNKLQLA